MQNNTHINRTIFFLLIIIFPWVSCDDKEEFDFDQHNQVAVSTTGVEGITKSEATLTGKINTKNGVALTKIGICYSVKSNPTISDELVLKSGELNTGSFFLNINGLKPSTIYNFRAFATNQFGTSYGENQSFTTQSGYVSKLETQEATNITRISAEISGKITDNGGYQILAQGICYSPINSMPTISNEKIAVDAQSSVISATLIKLTAGTRYYARSYATTQVGTGYGQTVTFTTSAAILATGISTTTPSTITFSSATVGGTVIEDNGSPINVRGLCYSATNSTPLITNATILNNGSGLGSFSNSITSLAANTTYYIRTFATNAAGTAYGPVVSFKTLLPNLPSNVSTTYPSNITMTSAYTGGNIGNSGGGTISARGVVYSSSTSTPSLTDGIKVSAESGTGSYSVLLSGLQSNTSYYVRAYATNQAGTSYGTSYSFKTSAPSLPSNIVTYSATGISQNSAYLTGYIGSGGGGNISAKGIVYSNSTTSPTLTNAMSVNSGSGTGNLSATLNGLSPNTTYYARVYATNESGTAYGNYTSFTTSQSLTAPTGVSTYSVTALGSSYVTLNGYITTAGGSTITERGFVYSSSYSSPTLSTGAKVNVTGNSVGAVSKSISGLNRYTTYYVRAFATNAYGTTYGSSISFYTN